MHGLVRDPDKKKMSRLAANVIDPLDIIDRFGTEAVRLSLLLAAAPGTDIVYTRSPHQRPRLRNKIWNAAA